MTVEERARIDRRIDVFFVAVIAFALVYVLLQIGRTFVTGGTLAPAEPSSTTTWTVHIVHMPTTNQIRIGHR